MKNIQTLSNKIFKSPNDPNLYRAIRLSNNLFCLLVHDIETKKSAAAVNVMVGAIEDPPEFQGLAHFCEHMLFLGSKTFPVQNHYKEFINSNGGSSNAFTASNMTVYYFDIENSKFGSACDIFSKFFIEPLFSEDGVDKEINAVNSEAVRNYNDDVRRKYQILKHLSNPESIYNKYSTGNLET